MSGKKLLVVAVATVLIALGIVGWTDKGSVEADLDEYSVGAEPYAGYIKLGDIDGEVSESGYVGWSYIRSFSQGIGTPETGAGTHRLSGETSLGDVVIVKELDKSSVKIQEACADGSNFEEVTIHLRSSWGDLGEDTYYEYELEDVRVVGYQVGSEDVEKEVPEETITLKVTIMTVIYTEYDDMGTAKGEVMYSYNAEKGTEK